MKWTEHWQNIQNNVIPAYDALIQRTQQLIQAEAGSIANEPQYPEDPAVTITVMEVPMQLKHKQVY